MTARLRMKTEKIINMALEFKMANDKLAKEMGYDYSSEAFLKGDR